MPSDIQALDDWRNALTYETIRQFESAFDATLPTGRRLRGILVGPNLVIARDKHFYKVSDGRAIYLPVEDVMRNHPTATFVSITREFTRVVNARVESRRRRRHE